MPWPDDDDGSSPFGGILGGSTGATNPELADKYLQQHRAAMQGRAPDIDNVLGKMQMTTDSMTKMLDDTTAAIKASRSGQVNLPLMAMAAGMLSNRGNFGNQLGEGLGLAGQAIQKGRDTEDNMQLQLAQLGMKKTMLEQAPLEAKLKYMQALQSGDLNAVRAIEQALIRSQASGANNSANSPKIIAKAVQDAMSEARKQVDNWAKDMDITGEEKEAEYNRRLAQNIEAIQASGIQIPDEVKRRVLPQIAQAPGAGPTAQSGPGQGMRTQKTFFDSPNAEGKQSALDAGLPPVPTGYIYDKLGRTDKTKMLTEQNKNFQKESKDWDEASTQQRTLLDQVDQAQRILEKNPKVVGPNFGMIPNAPFGMGMNISKDAQTLSSLFGGMQLHSIPKGQGAVSNMERELFAKAGPNMEWNAPANLKLLGIQREIINRDKDRREFFSEYFNNYKTTDGMVSSWDRYINSPQGSAAKRTEKGDLVPNTERTPWRDYFRIESGAGKRAKGGYIKLGSEYDD